jgi:hypothetical protein
MLTGLLVGLLLLGLYTLVTGEIDTWKKTRTPSSHTYAGQAAILVGLFAGKWAYKPDVPLMGYYPPFNEGTLGLLTFGLLAAGLYWIARGEVEYWQGTPSQPEGP